MFISFLEYWMEGSFEKGMKSPKTWLYITNNFSTICFCFLSHLSKEPNTDWLCCLTASSNNFSSSEPLLIDCSKSLSIYFSKYVLYSLTLSRKLFIFSFKIGNCLVSLSKSCDSLIALVKDSITFFDWFTILPSSSLDRASCFLPKWLLGSKQIFTGTSSLVSVLPDLLCFDESTLYNCNASSQLVTRVLVLMSLYTLHLKLSVSFKISSYLPLTLTLNLYWWNSSRIAHNDSSISSFFSVSFTFLWKTIVNLPPYWIPVTTCVKLSS